MLAQRESDRKRGFNTAGFVSGYRGSPLGGVDFEFRKARRTLEAADIFFQPGLNEDLALTSLAGTQQLGFLPDPKVDGVFGLWYGKGPGVDRSGDAIKHANLAGVAQRGGIVLAFGDDHAGKSSTTAPPKRSHAGQLGGADSLSRECRGNSRIWAGGLCHVTVRRIAGGHEARQRNRGRHGRARP